MSMNCTPAYILLFSILLAPALARAENPTLPAPPSEAQRTPAPPQSNPGSPEERYSPGSDTQPGPSSATSSEPATTMPPPSVGSPLAYSTTRSETALRIEDLMRGAAALRAQGDFSKAMELYNEVLSLAPRYAEGYRQRALTLVRLGDSVQAQVDYNRFLSLNPQASDRVREEVFLFGQSGRAQAGELAAAAYSYGPRTETGPPRAPAVTPPVPPPVMTPSPQEIANARLWSAQDAFQSGRYSAALNWATASDLRVPRARTSALIAQIRLAQGDVRSAAAQARAAAAMEPVIGWQTLFSYYGFVIPRFSQQLHALQEFVRQNPSSADGHFLLGYLYLILGQDEAAHAELAIAAVIEPNDLVAKNLLAKDGVEIASSYRPLAQAGSRPSPGSDLPPIVLQAGRPVVPRR